MQTKKIILASASPRRRELMAQAGYEFEIQVSHKEETYISETPDEIVKELALLKAKDIAMQNDARSLIIVGADTVVAHNGAILGKPKSIDDAFEILINLFFFFVLQRKHHKPCSKDRCIC